MIFSSERLENLNSAFALTQLKKFSFFLLTVQKSFFQLYNFLFIVIYQTLGLWSNIEKPWISPFYIWTKISRHFRFPCEVIHLKYLWKVNTHNYLSLTSLFLYTGWLGSEDSRSILGCHNLTRLQINWTSLKYIPWTQANLNSTPPPAAPSIS